MTAQDNIALARSQFDLFNRHGSDPAWLEKAVAYLADDFEQIDASSGRTVRGPDGFKQLNLFFADGFPDSRIEITHVVATEDEVVVEFTGRGTNTGPLHLPTGDVPATGRFAEQRFCDVVRIRNGKMASSHIYYDSMTMLQQLGLVPSRG